MFSYELCEIFQNTFFTKHLRVTASDAFINTFICIFVCLWLCALLCFIFYILLYYIFCVFPYTIKYTLSFSSTSSYPSAYPLDTGRKLNVHKTFRRTSSERLMYVQFTSCVYWVIFFIFFITLMIFNNNRPQIDRQILFVEIIFF